MNHLIISIKEASELSQLPATFIRKQVENRIIPKAYSIKHKYRTTYIIYRKPFMDWLEEIKDKNNG